MSTEVAHGLPRRRFSIKSVVADGVFFGFLFIVAFLTIFPLSDEQTLDLARNLLIGLVSFLAGAMLSFGLFQAGWTTLGYMIFRRASDVAPGETAKAWFKTFWGFQLFLTLGVFCVVGFQVTEFSFYELLSTDGFEGAKRIFGALSNPEPSVFAPGFLAIIETIFIAFIATMLAIPVAFVISFFCAKNIMGGSPLGLFVYGTLRIFFNIVRSCEPLIWAIIFSVWVGIGPFSGMLALMIHSVASLAKQYSEQIECISEGPVEGIQSTGAGFLQTIWFAVVPQVVLPFVSYTIYRWDINVRMATIIGLVGGGGIGTMLMMYQGQALWNEVGALVVIIAVVVWLMDSASAQIREALK